MNANPLKGESLRPSHPLLRATENVFATNPARLRIKAWSWLAANPGVLMLMLAVIVCGVITIYFKPIIGIALCLSGFVVILFTIFSARKKFLMGGICPGVILSAEDGLVAVFADLKASSGTFHPVIKIVRQPLDRFAAEETYDGMRVATVATFHGSASKPVWKDFSPEVIGCVVHNEEWITRAFESISEDQWQGMEVYLARVTDKKPGLYRSWSGADGDAAASVGPESAGAFVGFGMLKAALGLVGCFAVFYLVLASGMTTFKKWKNENPESGVSESEEEEKSSAAKVDSSLSEIAEPSNPSPVPSTAQLDFPQAGVVTNAVKFSIGQQVDARWDGRWIKATVLETVRGGIMLRVRLADPKFPHPVVVTADQVRAQ